jgi:SnoaL-like domain
VARPRAAGVADRLGGGNRGCSEWLLTGTTPEGERVEVRGCDLFEFEGDKIARKDSYWKLVER